MCDPLLKDRKSKAQWGFVDFLVFRKRGLGKEMHVYGAGWCKTKREAKKDLVGRLIWRDWAYSKCGWGLRTIIVCSGSVLVTAYDFESGRLGSNPGWGLIYYKASITAQGLPEPSSLRGSTLGTRAAEHIKGCSWGMQVDWWLQPRAVFGHSFSDFSWHMPQK